MLNTIKVKERNLDALLTKRIDCIKPDFSFKLRKHCQFGEGRFPDL